MICRCAFVPSDRKATGSVYNAGCRVGLVFLEQEHVTLAFYGEASSMIWYISCQTM